MGAALIELLLRYRPARRRGFFFGDLQAERVGVFAFDAEHVSVHDDGVTAAERLRDVGLLAFLERDFSADGDDRGFDVAGERY